MTDRKFLSVGETELIDTIDDPELIKKKLDKYTWMPVEGHRYSYASFFTEYKINNDAVKTEGADGDQHLAHSNNDGERYVLNLENNNDPKVSKLTFTVDAVEKLRIEERGPSRDTIITIVLK